MKKWLIIILLSASCDYTFAQAAKDTTAIINNFFSRYKSENPGGELAISKNGKVIFSKAWGLADLDHHVPYTTETVSEAGSISKQFTAASILLLAQQGKLSLDDDVRKYLPELPNYGFVISIKNLLHHTSGIREWSDLVAITGWPRTTKAYLNEDVYAMLCRQKKLNNIPGEEFIYSNSNYVLLTLIAEKVSGMTLPDFTRKYIFEPAGMTHTSWRDDYRKVVPNRAIAYSKSKGVYKINMPNENVYGPGGLLTTAEDLLKWANFYLNNKLGTPGLLDQQLTIEPLKSGAETNYAAGLFLDRVNGVKEIYHDGQTASYIGMVENFPSIHLSIAWLSNTTEFKGSLFDELGKIEDLLIKDKITTKPMLSADRQVYKVVNNNRYLGWYSYIKTNQGIKITVKNDSLYFDTTPLIPVADAAFRYKQSVLKFNLSGDFVLTTPDKRKLLFAKQKAGNNTHQYLQSFVGKYYSKETESDFSIVLKDGNLMLEKDNIKDAVLRPTYNEAFDFSLMFDSELSPTLENIVFRTDKTGVTSCEVSTTDARGVEFEKVK